MSASGCTMLTTHLKYGSLLFMFKIVANDMPWENRNLLWISQPMSRKKLSGAYSLVQVMYVI